MINKLLIICLLSSTSLIAENNSTKEYKDMSDPLAIYTRGGIGVTNRGINVKIGIIYKNDNSNKQVMNLLEIKGAGGELIGWDGDYERSNSIDSMRFRNFSRSISGGIASQIDITYNFESESGIASYSFVHELPKWKNFKFYPLLGVGAAYANNALQDDGTIQSGLSMPGVLGVVGMYAKYTVNDDIWINYNPLWSVGLVGSDLFMDYGFEGDSSVLTHEATISYKINARSNIRYFANWSENISIKDDSHRIEYNYQF